MLERLLEPVRRLFRGSGRSLPEPPRTFEDDAGREIDLRATRGDEGEVESLVDFYGDFDPSQRAQGTPPLGEEAVRAWLDRVLSGPSVIAWHGDRAVGHVVFVPESGVDRHELAIFVHRDYQRAGIGTELLDVGLGHARAEGVTHVWLTVEPWKRGAQKLYSRAGFTLDNPMGAAHRMSRRL